VQVNVVRIGNSRGIRISKRVLEQCQIEETVEMEIKGSKIILSPTRRRPREGWTAAARQMSQAGDDALLLPDVFDDEVEVEW